MPFAMIGFVLVERASEALQLVTHNDFALILCDLCMAQMTGIAFFEQLVGVRPALAERFVLLTRARIVAGVPLSIGPHTVRTLCKPFARPELDELLGRVGFLSIEA